MTWTKGKPTAYPVDYVLWQRTLRARIPESARVDDVEASTRTRPLVAAPVSGADPTSAWLSAPAELVEPLRRLAETDEPTYVAHAGVYSGLNGVYWLSVEGDPDVEGRIPVTNLHDEGRTQIRRAHGRVESELVHPLVRGSDVRRWAASPSAHILLSKTRGVAPASLRAR